jgi:hypothetical protein
MAMARGIKYWTKEDDDVVRALKPRHASELLERTYAAVVHHHFLLRHPELLEAKSETRRRPMWWTWQECKIMRRHYPTIENISDLMPLLPRFTLCQIKCKAVRLKIKRKFLGNADVRVKGHQEIIDQIRIRSKEDGIPLYKLDGVLGTGSYFQFNSTRRKANLRAVVKALDFFGGSLVIDWQDR